MIAGMNWAQQKCDNIPCPLQMEVNKCESVLILSTFHPQNYVESEYGKPQDVDTIITTQQTHS